MFNIGFLWLALSIGSEITGTSMIKKTNGFRRLWPSVSGGMCLFNVLFRSDQSNEYYSGWCCLFTLVRLWDCWRDNFLDDSL